MATFMPYWKPGKMPILSVTLKIGTMPREASVVVDGIVKYQGRSIAKASKACDFYRAKMEAQMKTRA